MTNKYDIDKKKIKANMSASKLSEAFNFKYTRKSELLSFIDLLMEDKLVKFNGQYYRPTQKLLQIAFLPETITIKKYYRIVLTQNEVFTKEEMIKYFGDDSSAEAIIVWLKDNAFIYQSSDCRYRKADKFDELLANGVEEIQTTMKGE
jgi:hypothetical protein